MVIKHLRAYQFLAFHEFFQNADPMRAMSYVCNAFYISTCIQHKNTKKINILMKILLSRFVESHSGSNVYVFFYSVDMNVKYSFGAS